VKNYRTPRSMSEAQFTAGYPEKRLPKTPSVHPSTWFIIALGLIGLAITIWTR
jgi:hypothetical protein